MIVVFRVEFLDFVGLSVFFGKNFLGFLVGNYIFGFIGFFLEGGVKEGGRRLW